MGEGREFPRELYARCGELGFLGLKLPEEYGGQGGDTLHDAVFAEEMARCGSGGVAAGIEAHAGIAMPPIFKFGTEEQKKRWIVPGIKGEKIGALGITEPGAGSDVAGLKTFARRENGEYVVNGAKTFITNGVRADFCHRRARRPRRAATTASRSSCSSGTCPASRSRASWRSWAGTRPTPASSPSPTSRCPAENLLGEENEGFYLIMANFEWERLAMALGAVGGMQTVFERTLDYAKEREAFGRPIGKLPGDPPQVRRDGDQDRGRAARSPTTPCACSSRARTASAR